MIKMDMALMLLPATSGDRKSIIMQAIDNLQAGGSTNEGGGIKLAYEIARENFIKKGNNRIILATDGDFNVGVTSDEEMFHLVETYRKTGIYITCLGFGRGNYQGSKLESIANAGNGNYAYIDSQKEADYVLGSGFSKTLYTIANDVKIQIEFNPRLVKSYRLIGYETRILNFNDFNNDRKDAGDMGSGFTVTALYEIIPEDSVFAKPTSSIKRLKYLNDKKAYINELATVKFRYKKPESNKSREVVNEIDQQTLSITPGKDFRVASSVAA